MEEIQILFSTQFRNRMQNLQAGMTSRSSYGYQKWPKKVCYLCRCSLNLFEIRCTNHPSSRRLWETEFRDHFLKIFYRYWSIRNNYYEIIKKLPKRKWFRDTNRSNKPRIGINISILIPSIEQVIFCISIYVGVCAETVGNLIMLSIFILYFSWNRSLEILRHNSLRIWETLIKYKSQQKSISFIEQASHYGWLILDIICSCSLL